MADKALNTLVEVSQPTSTQDLLLFDEVSNEGKRINYSTLEDLIISKTTSITVTGTELIFT